MKMKIQLSLIFAAGILAGPLLAHAQAGYDYQTIDQPGATFTEVLGINNRGDVVGNGVIFPNTFPFVYEARTGTLTGVAPVAGYVDTAVVGISDNGVLVGSIFDGSVENGLIIDQNGASTVFDHPDAVAFTQARGVNNKGLVSGFYFSSTASTLVGFIYDPKTDSFTDIGDPSSLQTIAHGINSRGEVVGDSFFFNEDDPCPGSNDIVVRRAWLRKKDGSISYFQVNGLHTAARGINDAGSIVGFVNPAFSPPIKGFVVELDDSPCQSIAIADSDLLEFPEFDFLFPEGITNSGVIVGIVNDGNDHGFIATPAKD